MPIIRLTFSLVADADGKVNGTSDQSPPVKVSLRTITVRSTAGCNQRSHNVTAGFRGGATFNFTGTLTDCTDLSVDLNSLPAPGQQTTTLFFEIDGFAVGEQVELEGELDYGLALFDFTPASANLVATAGTPVRSARDGSVFDRWPSPLAPAAVPVLPPGLDDGYRINRAKGLIYQWFALSDVRSHKVGEDLAALLDETFEIRLPSATLHTKGEFQTWYEQNFAQITHEYSELDTVYVNLVGIDSLSVVVRPTLHVEVPGGQQAQRQEVQAELHERADGTVRIRSYSMRPIG